MSLLLLAAPLPAEAQPRPLRVSELNGDPKKYKDQEVVLRAYFLTDISHYAIFRESRAIDDEFGKLFRALQGEADRGHRVDWKKLDRYDKYCVRVVNKGALYNKFGRGYAVNEHTVSVRGVFTADAGEWPLGGCQGHNAGFFVTEVLRKED